jgi:hypothetical protein
MTEGAQDLDFINLVTLVASTAAAELGEKKAGKSDGKLNLPRARQFINMLKVLQVRTEGRLQAMEKAVLDAALKDLQARYVKAAGLEKEDPGIRLLGRLAAQAYGQNPKKQL